MQMIVIYISEQVHAPDTQLEEASTRESQIRY